MQVPVQLAAMSTSLMVSCCQLSFICQNAAGVNLLNESNLVAGILLNTMFLLGTFTFAVVLGVVSDDISSEVKVLDHHASHYVQHAALISGALPIAACCHALGVCTSTNCPSGAFKLVYFKTSGLTPKCLTIINCCKNLAASGLNRMSLYLACVQIIIVNPIDPWNHASSIPPV